LAGQLDNLVEVLAKAAVRKLAGMTTTLTPKITPVNEIAIWLNKTFAVMESPPSWVILDQVCRR